MWVFILTLLGFLAAVVFEYERVSVIELSFLIGIAMVLTLCSFPIRDNLITETN